MVVSQKVRDVSLPSSRRYIEMWCLAAMLTSAVALAPPRPCLSPPQAPLVSPPRWTSRRPVLQQAAALVLLPSAASAAEKKPSVKDVVAQLDASTPKDERNSLGEKVDHFPQISFEGSQGQGKKVVFTVPHENLSPPGFSYIEFMWIKDESSGAILTAKRFTASDPNLVITAYGSSGQKLTAASKDNKYGIWQGTFIVP